jgi:hypothetical protein
MIVEYEKLTRPPQISHYLREIVNGVPEREIPKAWEGILIYHPATNQYYTSTSGDIEFYELVVREKPYQRYKALALVLRRLLNIHPQYQFFVMPMQSRGLVENWLASQGKVRVATRRGEAMEEEHGVFRVYSPFNKVERYVAAPLSTPEEKLVSKANLQFGRWLRTESTEHEADRETMRVALRSKTLTPSRIFDKNTARVARCSVPDGVCARNISAHVAFLNLEAVKEFVRKTTTGDI